MKNRGFQQKLICLGSVALVATAGLVFAQPPETAPNNRATARSKPQVIYHLPSSSSAATLHSQAKGPNTDVPNENNNSPQTLRPNPNLPIPQVRPETVHAPPEVQQQRRQQRVKSPKVQSVRAAKPSSMKAKGPGHGGPKKSHKK